MSGKRVIRLITGAKIRGVANYTNIRAIHGLPTINKYVETFNAERSAERYRRLLLTNDYTSFITLKRYKSGKKKQQQAQDDESDEDDIDEEELAEIGGQNAKVLTYNLSSMRIDLLVKNCAGMSRTKAEEALYESKIRINGAKALKKSIQTKIGDVIDFVRGPSPDNPDFIIVTRITILSAAAINSGYRVKIVRDKSLVIENYEDKWNAVNN